MRERDALTQCVSEKRQHDSSASVRICVCCEELLVRVCNMRAFCVT
jgi:hypothetical protein